MKTLKFIETPYKVLSLMAALLISPTGFSQNTFPASGNAGIGIASPAVPFEIGTTLNQSDPVFRFGNPQQYNQIIFKDRDFSSFLFGIQSNQIKIGTSGNDHKIMSIQYNAQNIELWPTVALNSPSNILINAGQNVGIGNVNPQYKLDVNGTVNATQFLVNGNPMSTLSGTGNSLYLPPGADLGIGTTNPQARLDVAGDAHVSGNLLVGGGIITTQTVNASIKINAGDIDVSNNLNVTGNAAFNGILTANQGLDIGGGTYFNSYMSPTPGVGRIIATGISGPINPNPGGGNDPSACVVGGALGWLNNGTNGLYSSQTFGTNKAWYTQFVDQTNGNSYIDASGTTTGSTPVELRVNEKCGSNTRINWASGGVYMGQYVFMKNNLEIGDPANGIVTGVGVKLNMKNSIGFNVDIIGNNSPAAVDAFKVSKNFVDRFNVNGEGQTIINSLNTNAFIVKNNTNNQNGFLINNDGTALITTYASYTGQSSIFNIKNMNLPASPNPWNQNLFEVQANGKVFVGTEASALKPNQAL